MGGNRMRIESWQPGAGFVRTLTIICAGLGLIVFNLAVFGAMADSAAQTFKILHSFKGGYGDGRIPEGSLVEDASGNLFGTTVSGGGDYSGTVFEIARQAPQHGWNYKVLHSFYIDQGGGYEPWAGVIVDTAGNLYGTTGSGSIDGHGNGVVYQLGPGGGKTGKKWTEKVLHDFCPTQGCTDGTKPTAGLTYAGAQDGAVYDGVSPLYGTTNRGGAHDAGTVYSLTRNGEQWTETILYSFCSQNCTDGSNPQSALIPDQAGNLYGVTWGGGYYNRYPYGAGVVYELTPNGDGTWSEIVLHRFCSDDSCADGALPNGSLVLDAAGDLLGTAEAGGRHCPPFRADGCGLVFKIDPNGQETVLHYFCSKQDCADGAFPFGGLTADPAENLFGTTRYGGGRDSDQFGHGGGTLFEISGTSFHVLHRFCSAADCADGEYPEIPLLIANSGAVYGTTTYGGRIGGATDGGTVFELVP
jgi:uncharacterized repeat protein (TIGR03803 family)